MSGMKCMDAEKVRNHWIDFQGFACAPRGGGCVILPVLWRGHARCRECRQEGDFMENKGSKIKAPSVFFEENKSAMMSGSQG